MFEEVNLFFESIYFSFISFLEMYGKCFKIFFFFDLVSLSLGIYSKEIIKDVRKILVKRMFIFVVVYNRE